MKSYEPDNDFKLLIDWLMSSWFVLHRVRHASGEVACPQQSQWRMIQAQTRSSFQSPLSPLVTWLVSVGHYHYQCKKLFSLNSSVMDDNHDAYKTANIKINQLF
jgi:hypothetical protein